MAITLALTATAACGIEPEADRIPGPDDLDDLEIDIVDTVEVSDTDFDPSSLEVDVDDAVVLEVTADEPVRVLGDRGIDSGTLLPDESQVVQLDRAGLFQWRLEGTDATVTITVNDPDA